MSDLETLRFPIGRFTPPAEFTQPAHDASVEALSQLPAKLRQAVKGMPDAQLDTPYREGGWTIRQVVHHLADSHTNAHVRVRLALTEDWPTIKVYEEAAWAELFDSRMHPVESSLAILDGLHDRLVALFRKMPVSDFEKGYTHPTAGRQTLAHVLALYDWHGRHHLAHITTLKTRMGW